MNTDHLDARRFEQMRGSRDADRISLRWFYFGLWTLYVWRLWMSNNFGPLPAGMTWQWLFGAMSFVLVAVAAVLLWRHHAEPMRRSRLAVSFPALWIAAALMVVSTVCAAVGAAAPVSIASGLAATSLVLGGVGIAWAYLQWGVFFAQIGVRASVAYLFGSGIVASVVKMLLFFLPFPAVATAVGCLPLASAWCLARSLGAVPKAEPQRVRYSQKSYAALWKAAAVIVAFSLANAVLLSLLKGPAETSSPVLFALGRTVEIVFSVGVLLWVFRWNRSFDFVQLWRFILFALGTVLLLNVLVGIVRFEDALISASFNFITLFVWLTCADIARRSDVDPMLVFACGWLAYAAPLFLGAVLASTFSLSQYDDLKVAFVLMYAMAVVVAVCLGDRASGLRHLFSDLNARNTEPEDFSSIDERCQALGDQYCLSPREIEVMQMICKGRSKAYIAETLFIAESTVKGHSKHLYAKLGVHSKRELQDMVSV